MSAKEAYKSYVRAYDSHSLKNIYDINKLDLLAVAKSFGFEHPPFVDLRKLELIIFSPILNVIYFFSNKNSRIESSCRKI